MKNTDFLTTPEACAYLRVSRTTLARLVESGRIPPPLSVTSRRSLWLREALDRYFIPYGDLVEDGSPVIDVDSEGRDAAGNAYDCVPSREALDEGLVEGRNVILRYPSGWTQNACEILLTAKGLDVLSAKLKPDAVIPG